MRFPSSWDFDRGQVFDRPVELRDIMPTLLDAAGAGIPESVDGSSLLDLARGKSEGWREFVQGEHTTCYDADYGMQYVTDGNEKYIWYHHTHEEMFFDLEQDPLECHERSKDPECVDRVEKWRKRLANINEQRGDPRGKSGQLVPQPDGALRLSPHYDEWKRRSQEIME